MLVEILLTAAQLYENTWKGIQ